MRLLLYLALAIRCTCGNEESLSGVWGRYMQKESVAMAYKRTREELFSFAEKCREVEPWWSQVHKAHEERRRVVVFDVRHNWNGLGDTHERLNFVLRVGRALQRATYLWLDSVADPTGPTRSHHVANERAVRNHALQAFDPGMYVQGLGNLHWRWTAAERMALEAAHPGEIWVDVRYNCHQLAPTDGMCGDVELTWGNGSIALPATGNASSSVVAAARVMTFLNVTLHDVPLLRVELSIQGQLTPESRLPGVCPRRDSPPGACDQSCESFLNWRPRASLWAALRPHLATLDQWAGAVSLTIRTGAADHFGALYHALEPNKTGDLTHKSLNTRLEKLFWPCPASAAIYNRNREPTESPCVQYISDRPGRPTPTVELAMRCGGDGDKDADSRLFNESSGTLASFFECSARVARALAAHKGQPNSWGLAVFSDAPGLKCLLEESSLAAAGRMMITPSAPGHVQYAPSGPPLTLVAKMTLVDWFLIGLFDWQTPVLGSAFGGASMVRGFRDRSLPAGSNAVEHFDRGFERWFLVGRENERGNGVGMDILCTLAETHDQCPVTQRSVAEMLELYKQAGPQGLLIQG